MSGTGYDPGGIAGPPGPASEVIALETADLLRAENPGVVTEAVRFLNEPGRGGTFFWDVTPAIDDGGTRFNVGGVGTTSAGWQRIPEGPLNALWFGLGGGTVDNATAIQRAINAAAAGGFSSAVYIPAGTYVLANGIQVPSNVELYGDGPTSHLSVTLPGTDTNAITGLGATLNNITIRDLRISGAFSRGINLSSTNGTGGSNVRVERCIVSGATEFAAGVTLAGIRLAGLDDCWIVENNVSGNGFDNGDGTGQGYDIVIDAGVMHDRMHVIGNKIDSFKTLISLAAFDCRDSEFLRNDIDQNNTSAHDAGIFHFGYGMAIYDAINLLECKRNRVISNSVRNCAGQGIYLESQFDSLVEVNTVQDVCKQITEPSLPLGAIVSNGGNTVINGNNINLSARDGIAFTYTGCVITDNYIEGVVTGVRIQGATQAALIQNNNIADTDYGVYLGNALSVANVIINDNKIDVSIDGILFDANTVFLDGQISNNLIDCGGTGVLVTSGSHNRICENNIKGGSGYGIQIAAGCDKAVVHQNIIANNSGLSFASNDSIITENDVTQTSVTAWSITGTGNTVRDNRDVGPRDGVFMGITAFNGGVTYTTGAYTKRLRIRLVAGGGGGGGAATAAASAAAGGGGAAGSYAEWSVVVAPNTNYAYAIGAAGAAGAAGANGGAGGNTTFQVGATTVTAPGGGGGVGMAAGVAPLMVPGGFTNVSTNGTINGRGAPGGGGLRLDGVNALSGAGGSGPFGSGGGGLYAGFAGIAGVAGGGSGAGGGGGLVSNGSAASAGGAGTAGLIVVEEYT